MKRFLVTLICAAACAAPRPGMAAGGAVPAEAQPKPAAAANAPAANAPAAAPAGGTPAANAPSASAPAASPTAAPGTVTVRVPSGGSYTAYIQEATTAAPKSIQDKGDLAVPEGAKSYTVYVLDPKSGYAARKAVTDVAGTKELSFASPDFKLVQKVRINVTGKGDKPIAQGNVSLTDSAKNTYRKIIQPASQGVAEFDFVVSGVGTVAVTPEGGSATTKEVTIDLPKGETVQAIPVALPEVTAVVEPPTSATPPAETANAPAPAPQAAPAQPAPQAAAPTSPAPASGGSDWGGTLIGFILLGAIAFAAYTYMKNNGITTEMLLKKLGVQPDTAVAGGGSLAGANSGVVPAPGAAPAPSPVVADPNQCQFCGQMKDGSGNCACTVSPGSLRGPAASFGAPAAVGSGPRLVGMAGTYLGQVFPLSGTAVIGREPTNGIPLDRDTTASRRHAQISESGLSFTIQDLGSANGTYVNGARITEATLSPGDEVAIGGTRFRFEV